MSIENTFDRGFFPNEEAPEVKAPPRKGSNINSDELRKRVLTLRMDGYSIRTIGEMVDCCYQSIANYLRSLQTSGKYSAREMAPYHEMAPDEIERFCDACVKADGIAKEIIRLSELPEEKVFAALDYVTTRKPMPCRDSVYPKVAKWMRHHCVTMYIFSDEIGIPQTKLRALMSGKEHISIELAEKINKLTGLSMTDIFSEQVPLPRKKKGQKTIQEVEDEEGDEFDECESSGVREDLPSGETPELVVPSVKHTRSVYKKPPMKKKQ